MRRTSEEQQLEEEAETEAGTEAGMGQTETLRTEVRRIQTELCWVSCLHSEHVYVLLDC